MYVSNWIGSESFSSDLFLTQALALLEWHKITSPRNTTTRQEEFILLLLDTTQLNCTNKLMSRATVLYL